MCKLFLLATLLSAALQTPTGAAQSSAGPTPQPVIVDVVVHDRDGNPVPGLKAEDFALSEDHQPQIIRDFEPHTPQTPMASGPELTRLQPGIFTNYTSLPPTGTLNILLLDALNTPTQDRSFIRNQLQQIAQHPDPGAHLAIFGLGSQPILLQAFDSDPATLRDVIDHKLIARSETVADPATTGGPGVAQIAANLQLFEAEVSRMQPQLRAHYTLDDLNTLAHYLAAFPGRKNLLWLSADFPVDILPAPTSTNPFTTMNLDEQEYRETTALLARAQVAVYPIEARSLITTPLPPPAKPAIGATQAAERSNMQTLAESTGGQAYFDIKDLASTIANAIQAGASYYTLAYTHGPRALSGSFHAIHVDLASTQAADLSLAYRRGYYDDDFTQPARKPNTSAGYAHAAMARGAPAPEDILFKVRVLPTSTQKETAVAAGNQLDPLVPTLGPFRRFAIDYAALPSEITLTQQPDGRRSGLVQFMVYVYNRDGRLLNTMGRAYTLNLKPETYQTFLQSALQCHLEISVPDRAETYLRIGIQDTPSNRFGVVEIPTSTVSRLPPPTPASATPATPSKSSAPATTPSTPPKPAPSPSR